MKPNTACGLRRLAEAVAVQPVWMCCLAFQAVEMVPVQAAAEHSADVLLVLMHAVAKQLKQLGGTSISSCQNLSGSHPTAGLQDRWL